VRALSLLLAVVGSGGCTIEGCARPRDTGSPPRASIAAAPSERSAAQEEQREEVAVPVLAPDAADDHAAVIPAPVPLPPGTIERITALPQRPLLARAMRRCYESALRAHGSLGGRIAVRVVIGEDGAVRDVSDAESSPRLPAAFIRCVARGIAPVRFPPPPPGTGTVVLVYPIVFDPSE
jgi:outer membrane biosynthesis protein TonB